MTTLLLKLFRSIWATAMYMHGNSQNKFCPGRGLDDTHMICPHWYTLDLMEKATAFLKVVILAAATAMLACGTMNMW